MRRSIAVTLQIALDHGLTADEYHRIQQILGRTPTFEELGVFSVMWSEHCSYKSSRRWLRELPTIGPEILQGPGENAGIVDVGEGLAVVFKIESHNHPSFIEPYHGAATGVGGILRDVFTMGARPIASLNSLRFGAIDHPRTPYLMKGVVAGIGGYGNCVGVPTVGGEVYFDSGYNGNILVNAFTLGVVRTDRIFKARAAGIGNPVIYVGSRTGRDGIHGASLLASREFDARSEELRPAVQVGDPFTEKLLIEACLALMQRDLIVAIQDMGAAGLTSSSVEMAGRGGTGIRLQLDSIPVREEGITPYELLLSESQERMLIVAKAGCEDEVKTIFARWDLQAEVVGHVTNDGLFRTSWYGEEVVRLPVESLTYGAPVYERPAAQPADFIEKQCLDLSTIPLPADYGDVLIRVLASSNLASKEWVYRQYDSFVCGNTVVHPSSDAAIIRLKGTAKGIGLSVDCNSRYCLLDPYRGAQIAVAEGARNLAVSGARPVALSDCLNFGNPEKPEVMWQFQQAIAGMRDACLALGLTVVSGNVSFYNETEGKAIPPTPTVATVGILADVTQHVTQWFKHEGDMIALIGSTQEELGASEYLATIHGRVVGAPPTLDLKREKRVQDLCLTAAQERLFASAHDVAEGGLAVALAESCISRPDRAMGARVTLTENVRADALLFGESQSRVLVSFAQAVLPRLQELARAANLPFTVLGAVGGTALDVTGHFRLPVEMLQHEWRTALARQLNLRLEAGGLRLGSGGGTSLQPPASPGGSMSDQHMDEMFDRFHEECGVVGVYGHSEAANLAYLALYALQHRGQESAGIASSNRQTLLLHRGMGHVADIFDEKIIRRLEGPSAIGHNRYSTTGSTVLKNSQPLLVKYTHGSLAVAHNGNLVNAEELRARMEEHGSLFQSTVDTEVILHLIAASRAPQLVDRIIEALWQVRGAYSLVFLSEDEMIAVRDPHGFRPLVLGRMKEAGQETYIVTSETCALDLIGATYEREVEPGEVLSFTSQGMTSFSPFSQEPLSRCVFEHIYFSRPDSVVYGRSVYQTRKEFGRQLAREAPTVADIVIPVPDSGVPAALGYAEEARLPFEMGLIRNHYVGRTFIEPRESIRHFGVKVKLNAQPDVLRGKRVVVVDDSIIRGTTSRKIVKMIRDAGAREVHLRISSPPTIGPCFYGVDTPTRRELIAASHSIEEIRRYVTADSLAYLSEAGMYAALKEKLGGFCDACFTGRYPVSPGARPKGSQLSLFGEIER